MTAVEQVNQRIVRTAGNKRAHTVAVGLQEELNEARGLLQRTSDEWGDIDDLVVEIAEWLELNPVS